MSTEQVNETTHVGESKIQRYKWIIKDSDKPGSLQMVHKSALHVDHSYQRNAVDGKVLRIAKEFSWIAFGALIVGNRDGKLFVLDGQHRLNAVLKRVDVQLVPCVIFDIGGIEDEAKAFRDVNSNRKTITANEKFRADIVSGNPHALVVGYLISSIGRHQSNTSGPNSVNCVSLLMSLAEDDTETLRSIWPVIAEVSNGHPIRNELVKAIFWAEKHMPSGETLTHGKWRRRLREIGLDQIIEKMRQAAVLKGSGGAGVYAEGLRNAINFRLRSPLEFSK